MGCKQMFTFCTLLQTFLVFIIAFSSSHSHAQRRNNEIEEDNHQGTYFFYKDLEYPRDCRDFIGKCTSANVSSVVLIKPNGYPEPFEVYCDNDSKLAGWTVIQRRVDGSVDFNRGWQEYKNGFGFLSTEFWLDISCPQNMIFGNCTCRKSCDDPRGLDSCNNNCNGEPETCVCATGFVQKDDRCVLPSECECFITETNAILSTGETYISAGCSEKCTCNNGTLQCNLDYRCDANAACTEKNGLRGCDCHDGYEGDGETCTALYTDCYDVYRTGQRRNGVYSIKPSRWPGSPFNVYCDMTTAGGGWTLFQRRIDGVTNFYRNWAAYKRGFGSVEHGNDFWLGNDQLHYLTNQRSYTLRLDMVDSGGTSRYGEYTTFEIGDNSTKYRLTISGHTGNTCDGMYYTNQVSFSTFDQDNDGCSYHHCSEGHGGAWWYKPHPDWCAGECANRNTYCHCFQPRSRCSNCCTRSSLNGKYNGGIGQNIFWYNTHFCNLNSVEMKIRPSSP